MGRYQDGIGWLIWDGRGRRTGTFLCKRLEFLCESDTRKLCRGLTKTRITHGNNAYGVRRVVFSFFFFSSVQF